MKNKTVINTPHNSAVLPPTSGNRDRNTLSQLAANHVSSTSAQFRIACGPASLPLPRRDRPASPCQRQVLIIPLSRGVTRKCLLRLGLNNEHCLLPLRKYWEIADLIFSAGWLKSADILVRFGCSHRSLAACCQVSFIALLCSYKMAKCIFNYSPSFRQIVVKISLSFGCSCGKWVRLH